MVTRGAGPRRQAGRRRRRHPARRRSRGRGAGTQRQDGEASRQPGVLWASLPVDVPSRCVSWRAVRGVVEGDGCESVTEHEAWPKNIVARDGSQRRERKERWATRMEDGGRRVRPHTAQLLRASPGSRRAALGLGRDGFKVCAADGASICVLRGGVVGAGGCNRRAERR